MPDKPATVAAYAAGASLAAITLFYVFGPTFFIDGDGSGSSDGRKRTIIGLANPANDCFINSVLQALAGLGELRLYMIKELHRRQLDGTDIYETIPLVLQKYEKPEKIRDLQQGPVTRALKEMLDALNERPIYKKTITARPIIEALERAYQTRISRNQQDAHEFLQIVLERLSDEFHAGEKARKRHNQDGINGAKVVAELPNRAVIGSSEAFPFEGRIESQIQCMHCGFKTKPSVSTFVSLTLNVPQASSTTLDKCFDILLKTEDIDDYKCDKCRLKHALDLKLSQSQSTREEDKLRFEDDIRRLERAIAEDPEIDPEGVVLPDSNLAPKRKIKKHMRITLFPKVISIHLSRSVFDSRTYSSKNLAKVAYSERLRLGGILNEHWYKLLGVVCHKGSHSSGHYESFRRNHIYPPFATPDVFSAYAAASKASITDQAATFSSVSNGDVSSTPSASTVSLNPTPSRPTTGTMSQGEVQHVTKSMSASSIKRSITQGSRPQIQSSDANSKKKKKSNDRWWRISDDKIKEARTSEVLGMQREVYLLFYELERPGDTTRI